MIVRVLTLSHPCGWTNLSLDLSALGPWAVLEALGRHFSRMSRERLEFCNIIQSLRCADKRKPFLGGSPNKNRQVERQVERQVACQIILFSMLKNHQLDLLPDVLPDDFLFGDPPSDFYVRHVFAQTSPRRIVNSERLSSILPS